MGLVELARKHHGLALRLQELPVRNVNEVQLNAPTSAFEEDVQLRLVTEEVDNPKIGKKNSGPCNNPGP